MRSCVLFSLSTICLLGTRNTQSWLICLYLCFKMASKEPMLSLLSSAKIRNIEPYIWSQPISFLHHLFFRHSKWAVMRSHSWSSHLFVSNTVDDALCVLFSPLAKSTTFRKFIKRVSGEQHVCSSWLVCLSKYASATPCLLSACASRILIIISVSFICLKWAESWIMAAPLFSPPKKETDWCYEVCLGCWEIFKILWRGLWCFCLCLNHLYDRVFWFSCLRSFHNRYMPLILILQRAPLVQDALVPHIYHLQALLKSTTPRSCSVFCLNQSHAVSPNVCALFWLKNSVYIFLFCYPTTSSISNLFLPWIKT